MLSKKAKGAAGKLILLAITLFWGSSFIILKNTLSEIGGGHFTFFVLAVRFLISGLAAFAVGAKKIVKMNRQTLVKGLILGFILAGAYAVQTLGLKRTTASKNAFLTAAYCVMIPFFAWGMLGKKPSVVNVVSAALCFIGIALVGVVGRGDSVVASEIAGDILSLSCGVFYALQIIFIDKFAAKEDPLCLLTVELITVGAIFGAVTLIGEFPFYGGEFSLGWEAVLKILYLSLAATFLAQLGQIIGQKWTEPTVASLILSLESVFGVLFEILLGDSALNAIVVTGFAVIFIAEILNEVGPKIFRKNRSNG